MKQNFFYIANDIHNHIFCDDVSLCKKVYNVRFKKKSLVPVPDDIIYNENDCEECRLIYDIIIAENNKIRLQNSELEQQYALF